MQELILKIEQWAEDRNIIKGSKPIDQAMKLFSEFGELADNIGKGRDCRDDVGDIFVVLTIMCKQMGHSINDHIGTYGDSFYGTKKTVSDLASCLASIVEKRDELEIDNEDHIAPIDMATAHLDAIALDVGSTLEECVQIAYDDIKDRKGLMHNGVFLKESDPVYAQVIAEIEGNLNVE